MPNGDAALAYGEQLAELRRKVEEYVKWLRECEAEAHDAGSQSAFLLAAVEAKRRLLGREK